MNSPELEYKSFNKKFLKTIFHDIFLSVIEKCPLEIGRVRLMRLNSKSCYSVHEDPGLRLHLPIITNPDCFFCFESQGFHYLPAKGRLYCTNTLLRHTVVNGGKSERIHLVISTGWKDLELEKLKTFFQY